MEPSPINPNKGFSAYVASKGGLVSLTKAIAMENGPAIRANVVAPSAVDTAFLGGGTADGGEQPGADSWFKQNVEAYIAASRSDALPLPTTSSARSCSWPAPAPATSRARSSMSTAGASRRDGRAHPRAGFRAGACLSTCDAWT
jgi:NAD(P)-dependent dehydrogenase (short-subunit alcohol dehydrogenase family)